MKQNGFLSVTFGTKVTTRPSRFQGSIANIYCAVGHQINLDDPTMWNGLYDASTDAMLRISSNGRTAFPGVVPQINLAGGSQMFPLNFAQWTNSVDDPFALTTDAGNGEFQVASGALQTSVTDPYISGVAFSVFR